jgi:hypothetical protein
MNEQNISRPEIRLGWTYMSLPYSYKKLAVELFKQRDGTAEICYGLPILFLHTYIESLLFENFATIAFSARAGISTEYQWSREQIAQFVKQSQHGSIIDRIDFLTRRLVVKCDTDVDINLLDQDDRDYLARLVDIRNYLVHGNVMTTPLMRAGGSAVSLQSENATEDLEDAFRITVALEPRLISTLRHTESTLCTRVCTAHASARNSKTNASVFFDYYAYEIPSGKYRSVLSMNTWTSLRISEIASQWSNFLHFKLYHWPLRKASDSVEKAIDSAGRYIRRHFSQSYNEFSSFKSNMKLDRSMPPQIDQRDWPWTRHSANSQWAADQLQKLWS